MCCQVGRIRTIDSKETGPRTRQRPGLKRAPWPFDFLAGQHLLPAAGHHVVDALLRQKSVGLLDLPQTIKEDGQVVVEVQLLQLFREAAVKTIYCHLKQQNVKGNKYHVKIFCLHCVPLKLLHGQSSGMMMKILCHRTLEVIFRKMRNCLALQLDGMHY